MSLDLVRQSPGSVWAVQAMTVKSLRPVSWYTGRMILSLEIDREEDGRWFAVVPELPGVICYGVSREAAVQAAKALALHVIADKIEHGELDADLFPVDFARAA